MHHQETITITFGDQAENFRGMQKIGAQAAAGISTVDLLAAKERFEAKGATCELIRLDKLATLFDLSSDDHSSVANVLNSTSTAHLPDASILIVRRGMDILLRDINKTSDDALMEQQALAWDAKSKMYGRVVNRKIRVNLCFADEAQEADYAQGRGTVVPFHEIPCLQHIRNALPEYLGPKTRQLVAEGNRYMDLKTCGIRYHGDSERKVVVACRMGASFPLHYQWYHDTKPFGRNIKFVMNHGDCYIMSDKAVGYDWLKPTLLTLRHAAGARACTFIPKNKSVDDTMTTTTTARNKQHQKQQQKEKNNNKKRRERD